MEAMPHRMWVMSAMAMANHVRAARISRHAATILQRSSGASTRMLCRTITAMTILSRSTYWQAYAHAEAQPPTAPVSKAMKAAAPRANECSPADRYQCSAKADYKNSPASYSNTAVLIARVTSTGAIEGRVCEDVNECKYVWVCTVSYIENIMKPISLLLWIRKHFDYIVYGIQNTIAVVVRICICRFTM